MASHSNHPVIQQFCHQKVIDCSDLLSVERVSELFADSSCQVWRINLKSNTEQAFFLKSAKRVQNSLFWHAMEVLFDLDINQAFQKTPENIKLLSEVSCLTLPSVVGSIVDNNDSAILLTGIKGESVKQGQISQKMVLQLAEYLAGLHGQKYPFAGALDKNNAEKSDNEQGAMQWRNRVEKGIVSIIERLGLTETEVNDLQLDYSDFGVSQFVPIMVDLRWDQFAQQNGSLCGVYDLDAYVVAPVELDFVILEYLLTEAQLFSFKEAYEQYQGAVPSISGVRNLYRSLFYLMNALGESDYQKWMAQPHFFE